MKTFLLCLLLPISLVAQPFADVTLSQPRASAAAGGSCPGSPTASNDGATAITFGGGNIMIGQADWTDGGTPRTICRLDFEITGATGASGKTFYAKIYQMKTTANTYDLDVVTGPVATSTGVTGVDAWSATWVQFDFPTPFTTTASRRYALVVTLDVAFGSNDMTTFTDNTALTGYRDAFSAAGAAQFAGGNDVSIRIYWQ